MPDDETTPSLQSPKPLIDGGVINRGDMKVIGEMHTHLPEGSVAPVVTAAGQTCPICGQLVKDEWGKCLRCERTHIHKDHFRSAPDFFDEADFLCSTCYSLVTSFHDAETAVRKRDYDSASVELMGARRAIKKLRGDPILADVEQLEAMIKKAVEADHSDETQRRRRADFRAGEIITGRYEVVELLGRGGMGKVYLVQDRLLDGKQFALKFLHSELAQLPSGVERLKKEALRMGELTHPHILRLWEFGQEGENFFLKMEYAAGGTLDRWMDEQDVAEKPLSLDQVLELLPQICAGLDYAHSKGIVHRDLKPANIARMGDGTIKIMDFGLAAVMKDTLSRVSAQTTSGTLLYMSPEQMTNPRKVNARSDLYSLGAIIYELLSGYPPFPAERAAIREKLGDPPFIEELNPEVNDVLMRMLSVDQEKRPASAMELLQHLEKAGKTPVWPVCPVCGEAKEGERFSCSKCGKVTLCIAHRGKEGLCGECWEVVKEEQKVEEERAKQEKEAKRAEEARRLEEKRREDEKRLAEERRAREVAESDASQPTEAHTPVSAEPTDESDTADVSVNLVRNGQSGKSNRKGWIFAGLGVVALLWMIFAIYSSSRQELKAESAQQIEKVASDIDNFGHSLGKINDLTHTVGYDINFSEFDTLAKRWDSLDKTMSKVRAEFNSGSIISASEHLKNINEENQHLLERLSRWEERAANKSIQAAQKTLEDVDSEIESLSVGRGNKADIKL